MKEVIRVPVLSDAIDRSNVPLSAAVKANGFVFVSGLPPIDMATGRLVEGDAARQTEVCLENVKATLEAAGSSLEKVVKVVVYSSNAAWFAKINEVYRRYFATDPPARTFVTVGSWPLEFDV